MPSADLPSATTLPELRETLTQLIGCVAVERELLRKQDYAALLGETQRRQQLNLRLAPLKASLEALGPSASAQPGYSEVMRLARELSVADSINRRLLSRTLGVVRAFRSALKPAPVAYDRRGARPAFESCSSTSRRV